MIIDEIVLHNFGVYKGRQSINLTPVSAQKPIILFGGLNGAGKTTLLDALRLALYGKMANCSNRGHIAYDKFLKKCINHHVHPSEGTSLEVAFRQHSKGKENAYRISRAWSYPGKLLKETVAVTCNGEIDQVLTDNWSDFAEGFIPSSIADLFFFDGEKIAEIAEPENTAQFLRTAIDSLLGLNVVTQLHTDLSVLVRRKQVQQKSKTDRDRIKVEEAALEKLLKRKDLLITQRASQKCQLEQLTKKIEKVEETYKRAGGSLFEQRQSLEIQQADTKTSISSLEEKMRGLASKALPLALITDLLKDVTWQAQKECDRNDSELILRKTKTRDKALIQFIAAEAPKELSVKIKKYIAESQKAEEQNIRSTEIILGSTSELLKQCHSLQDEIIPSQLQSAADLRTEHEKQLSKLTDLERKIEAIPDPETIKPIIDEIKHRKIERETISIRREAAEQELDGLNKEIELQEKRVISHIEQAVDSEISQEKNDRTVLYAQKAQRNLKKFKERIIQNNISKLETLILQSFDELIRKRTLVKSIQIDPKEYQLTLIGTNGQQLPTERLSAGERQLLAVAMVWGLARASGRPLPAIVDTPLGRLDSHHRKHLVTRYFPYASHQVMLLSTDEEINENHLEQLKSRIGRSYYLDYNQNEQTTTVKEGYFTKEPA
jgi:DNA sulfur modification protein DndD